MNRRQTDRNLTALDFYQIHGERSQRQFAKKRPMKLKPEIISFTLLLQPGIGTVETMNLCLCEPWRPWRLADGWHLQQVSSEQRDAG